MMSSGQDSFEEIYKEISEQGTFYMPASKHYNDPTTNVYCNSCQKGSLQVCIGYKEYDLCMDCVQKLADYTHLERVKKSGVVTMMETSTFKKSDKSTKKLINYGYIFGGLVAMLPVIYYVINRLSFRSHL